MKITKKSGYGLIAMAELARNNDNHRYLSTIQISKKYDLPQPFLEKIMRELKDAGLVKVKRGRGGGYELRSLPEQVSIEEIIRVLEDHRLAPVACLDSNNEDSCPIEENCPTLKLWKEISDKFTEVLQSLTLSDLVNYMEE